MHRSELYSSKAAQGPSEPGTGDWPQEVCPQVPPLPQSTHALIEVLLPTGPQASSSVHEGSRPAPLHNAPWLVTVVLGFTQAPKKETTYMGHWPVCLLWPLNFPFGVFPHCPELQIRAKPQ